MDYEYFLKRYKLIAIDLTKQIELENSDLKEQINFIGRLERNEGAAMFFIIERSEETTFESSQNSEMKFANLLGNATINLQNLQRKNGMLSMIRMIETMVMEMKMVQPLNLKLKSLNEIFVIIQTHIFL